MCSSQFNDSCTHRPLEKDQISSCECTTHQNLKTTGPSKKITIESSQLQTDDSYKQEPFQDASLSSINTVKEFNSKKLNARIGLLHDWSIRPFTAMIRFYQLYISPLTPPTCRFTPTCSNYALGAYRHFGLWGGTWRTLNRLLRCHPWHPGGYDPVISHEKKN
jgi:uncharacterized protein